MMISVLLVAACAIHPNKLQTGIDSPRMIHEDVSDIPVATCALVATQGIPVYSRPIESPEYQVAKLNWGAFPVVDSPLLPPEGDWMAIATSIGVEAEAPYRSIVFVRSSVVTFNLSQSTMSPGDAEETDWSNCTNTPTSW